MIKLKIDGVHFELDKATKRYVRRKLGRLDRYIPRPARQPAHGEVALIQNNSQPNQRFTCEVKMILPKETLVARESTVVSMHTAIDGVEEKLKSQLLKYKTKQLDNRKQARRFMRRLRRFGR